MRILCAITLDSFPEDFLTNDFFESSLMYPLLSNSIDFAGSSRDRVFTTTTTMIITAPITNTEAPTAIPMIAPNLRLDGELLSR